MHTQKKALPFAYQSKERKGFFCHTQASFETGNIRIVRAFFPTKTHAKDKRNPFSFKKVRGIHTDAKKKENSN